MKLIHTYVWSHLRILGKIRKILLSHVPLSAIITEQTLVIFIQPKGTLQHPASISVNMACLRPVEAMSGNLQQHQQQQQQHRTIASAISAHYIGNI